MLSSFKVYQPTVRNCCDESRIPDMPKFYNKKNVFNAMGKKGTLVISDQFGIHRGIAQLPDKKRVALIFNFNLASDK